MKRRCALKISYDLLHSCLNLKDNCEIIDVISEAKERKSDSILIKIQSPDCHELREGDELMWIPISDVQK